MHRTDFVIIVCAGLCAQFVSAQVTVNNMKAATLAPPVPAQNAGKPDGPPPAPTCPPPPPPNIHDGTKAALACEWISADGVLHNLKALEDYAVGDGIPDAPAAAAQALCELISGDPTDEDLYRAAQGLPDATCPPNGSPGQSGELSSQGLPDFLDLLEKANILNKKAPADEDQLFSDADTVIGEIFNNPSGKQELSRIHDLFSQKKTHVALFRLLKAYPFVDSGAANRVAYALKLQILRAAYEMNADHLATLVAGKIAKAK
jgi:hypothetical protein